MGVLYMAFLDGSIFLAGVATIAYFWYAYSQYTSSQQASSSKHKGNKRTLASRSLTVKSVSPAGRFLHTMAGYMAHQSSQVQQIQLRGGAVAIDRDFEVADVNLPVTIETQAIGQLGSVLTWLAAFTLIMTMFVRTAITHHAPWVNLYEASIALSAFVTVAYIFFEMRYHTRALGVFVNGISFLLLLFALWVGAAFNQAEPLEFHQITPALQDNPILSIHVSMMIVSYAFFIVAFACGVLMLVQGEGKARFAWLPGYDAADELGYRAVTIGFPVLALGIILGAWWANYAWGHYWSWDPKETSALITWLVYAIYLHARGLRGWRGQIMGWLLVAGFAATLFTYFGVSFIIPGLHSYSGVK